MYSTFLADNTTHATELRDVVEWHQGIQYFGFWAIEIFDTACREKIRVHQAQLAPLLHPDYLRQPHITLWPAGLMAEQHYNKAKLHLHIAQLIDAKISAFSLRLSSVNSFMHCPYLAISDPLDNLNRLRQHFSYIAPADSPMSYTPHVTLGFYNQAYPSSDLVTEFVKLNWADIEFRVTELIFAQYKTKDIQGPYQVLHRIRLAST